jgi:DNA-binding winged helix-turn-helix (wHTH) protein/tetratricopeptide (TPR) repeat protein
MIYRFGPFAADRTAYRVLRNGQALDLTPKLLDLLFYLLERPATLVTKESLLDGVWPDANVTDNALAQAVSELRETLGDRAAEPTYIRTVARRGYRFVAPVEVTAPAPRLATVPATRAVATNTPTVGVLDFTNVTGDQDIAWLSSGIAETVTSDLTKLEHFHVVDRWRIVQAARTGSGSAHELGAALGLSHAVVGSFQRQGPQLRITARLVDLSRGSALADTKVDGPLIDAFALQDGIVAAFARELGLAAGMARPRSGLRETASLEACRAYTEGWLKVEGLDTDLVPAAIADFERAIALDPRYAMAHTGLANALFVAYEMSRVTRGPNGAALETGVEHAMRAIRLDPKLAEAHATLSFLLVSAGRFDEARASALSAVAIEPDNWRHQYRLGHASWGEARLRACERALAIYPQFAYARFEMAMVFVARNELHAAEGLTRPGADEQDRQAESGHRFPAVGFHWLLGAIEAARDRPAAALAEFDREMAYADGRRLYGPEYGALTLVARGHALLALDRREEALAAFREARAQVPEYPRAALGERQALRRLGRGVDAPSAVPARAGESTAADRAVGGQQLAACASALDDRPDDALDALEGVVDDPVTSFIGWSIPLEPAFLGLRSSPRFQRLLSRLAERAR